MQYDRESYEQILEIARRDTVFKEFVEQQQNLATLCSACRQEIGLEFKTTVIAFRTVDGGIIAADSRGTLGQRPIEGQLEKLFVIDQFSVLGISGLASEGQLVARFLEREFEVFTNRFHPPHPKSKANRVAEYLRWGGGNCVPLFVTYDHQEKRARIFSYDTAGAIQEMKHGYAAIGSGSEPIRSQVRAFAPMIAAKPALEAIPAVVYLLTQAARFDHFTGGDFFVHILTAETAEGAGGMKQQQRFVIPEAVWRLDALFSTEYDFATETVILQKVLQHIEELKRKYATMPHQKQGPEDSHKGGNS